MASSLKILYFAWVREKTGKAEEVVALPTGVDTVGDLIEWLKARDARHAAAFAKPEVIRAAVDRRHVSADAPLAGAREIAFFPPVTGG